VHEVETKRHAQLLAQQVRRRAKSRRGVAVFARMTPIGRELPSPSRARRKISRTVSARMGSISRAFLTRWPRCSAASTMREPIGGDELPPARRAVAFRLTALVRDGEIAVRLPPGRDPQVEGGANHCGHGVLPPSIACREQLVEQVAEPSLEHVDLGVGHWHVLRPVIGHRPGDQIGPSRSPRAASRSARVVVQVVRGRHARALSPRFLEASHGASVAPVAIPQNNRSPRRATP
jgi:hypothetical protein